MEIQEERNLGHIMIEISAKFEELTDYLPEKEKTASKNFMTRSLKEFNKIRTKENKDSLKEIARLKYEIEILEKCEITYEERQLLDALKLWLSSKKSDD